MPRPSSLTFTGHHSPFPSPYLNCTLLLPFPFSSPLPLLPPSSLSLFPPQHSHPSEPCSSATLIPMRQTMGGGVVRETVATETEAIFYHVIVVIILPHSAQQFGASLRIWRDYLTERVQGRRCLYSGSATAHQRSESTLCLAECSCGQITPLQAESPDKVSKYIKANQCRETDTAFRAGT